jgi:hypothetical protein
MYTKYYTENNNYYKITEEIYNKILGLKLKYNKTEINGWKGQRGGWTIYILFIIWTFYFIRYLQHKKIIKEYNKNKKELKKEIDKYKGKSNFA